jgi:uncharacterized protein
VTLDLAPPRLVHAEPQPLHPAIRQVWQWSSVITWGIMAIVFGVPEYLFVRFAIDRPFWVPISPFVCVGFALLGWWLADRQYRAWTYQLREDDLVLSHGLLWRSKRCVARDRVQHIDINSGPLDRKWGLVQVSIYVAGAMGTVGSIPGLTPEDAEALRAAVLEGRAPDA